MQRSCAPRSICWTKRAPGERRCRRDMPLGSHLTNVLILRLPGAVEVSLENKRPRIHRATVAVNCGLAGNPLTVKSQFQAGLGFGITQLMAKGAITLKDGRVEQRNFDGYTPPYIVDTPVTVDVHIVP